MGAIEEPGLEILGKRNNAGPQDKWTTERVLSIRYWTPTLVTVRTTRYRGFRFTPGHYTRLGLGAADDYFVFVARPRRTAVIVPSKNASKATPLSAPPQARHGGNIIQSPARRIDKEKCSRASGR